MAKFKSFAVLAVITILCALTANAQKPNIYILATGGTIAGSGTGSSTQTNYHAGGVAIQTLIDAVPAITEVANVTGEQVVNIGSQDMTTDVWLTLANRINELLARQDVDGIVITHGTDTMEETAYFLDLTVKSDKPVVITGAMRASTAISADGPLNLYNSVVTAACPESKGKGVLVVMNGIILDAHSVIKMNTVDVQTFQAPNSGPLGYLFNSKVFYNDISLKKHTSQSVFDVTGLKELPKVGIIYSYADIDADVMEPYFHHDYKGIVHAGLGNGNYHKNLFPELLKAREKGIIVVRSSRVPTGPTTLDNEVDDAAYQFVASQELNPQKARILLMLALTKTSDWQQIQQYFMEY